jgi:hypothetical protein
VSLLGAGGEGPVARCSFTFDVTTVTAHGRFSPRNVGAIWIEDASSKFVKTLRKWGVLEIRNATAWTSVSNSNVVDAVTGATRLSHGALDAKWDCTDVSRVPVPAGDYKVCVTFAEENVSPIAPQPPHEDCVLFHRAEDAVDSSPPDAANFVQMHVTLQ